MDFEKEIHRITALVPEGITLAPETTTIAIEALEAVDARYGPDSPRPLAFHNAPHSVGVTRRSIRLTNMLLPYVQDKHRPRFYDLAIINGATHDYDQDSGPGANEDNSTEYAIQSIEAADGELNSQTVKDRVALGIAATKVEMLENGELLQANLQRGPHDPIKFIMAFSDINGIAMEGEKRMWRDATNLYYEIATEPTLEGHADFLISQAGFLSQRLNDPRVKADLAYHFPNDINAAYSVMHKAFNKQILRTFDLAVFTSKHPDLKGVIEGIAKTADRSRVGGYIGKALTKRAAADQ